MRPMRPAGAGRLGAALCNRQPASLTPSAHPLPRRARSFNNVQYWMENIQKHANPNTRKLLLGNKIDAKGKKVRAGAEPRGSGRSLAPLSPLSLTRTFAHPPPPPQIASERGRAVAEQFGMRFMETSAMDGTNVRESFAGLARDVVESMIASGLLAQPDGGAGDAPRAAGAAGGGGGGGGAAKKDCAIV